MCAASSRNRIINAIVQMAIINFSKTKILQKSGIQKNEVIELIYRGFI